MNRRSSISHDGMKRRKISVACDDCRARKVRCDGVQPVCGPCSKRTERGVHCIYTGELVKKRARQTYISNLESRIRQLESPQGSENAQGSGHTPCTNPPTPAPGAGQPNTSKSHARSIPSERNISTPIGDGDGVNAMMGAVEEERASQGFFGSSSAAGFMRQIRTAVDKRVSSPHQGSSKSHTVIPSSIIPKRSERPQSSFANYVLPPRKMADSLMQVYWDYVFPLYPFLIPAEMKEEYKKIWKGDSLEYDESMLMCTLNVIFALASQLADFMPPTERETSADVFFSRAKGLFQFNLWDTGSMGLIQCLLLMAQYLQSTDSAHQCWIVTGLAIRNAQSLGLHLPQTINRLETFRERQLACKIWHGCILMDRVISMTFGRPAMISKTSSGAVPLPAAVDEEYIPPGSNVEVSQPSNLPSIMAFFGKSLELYEIMNDILLNLYKPMTDEGSDDIHDFYFDNVASEGDRTIFELDRSLTRWTRSLPPHLHGNSPLLPDNPIFCRQSIVLRARFLHVRMLLFRPTLSKYCAIRDSSSADPFISMDHSFPHRVALQCSTICVKAAQESIELIYNNVPADGTGGPLPAWWYNILYVYTSATVLIAGRLCSAILAEVTEDSVTRSWHCALEILRKYESYSTSARRCVAALEILYEQVVSEGLPPPNQTPRPEVSVNSANAFNEMSFGEGMNAAFLDSFELPDFQDMSWLNSVPSNLF